MRIPLGTKYGDYNSRKSRGRLVNMIPDTDREGNYLAVRRCWGLTEIDDYGSDPIRSNIHVNGDTKYFVAGDTFYQLSNDTVSSVGTVNGSGRAQVLSNAVPGDNQILILNGSGDGYIYDNSGLNEITDPDFFSTTSATVLNERFWFTRDGRNEIFASDVSDGTAYDPLSFISAEYKPDEVVVVVSKKSALWVIGTRTMEYFQSVDDPTVPLRPVKGASQDIGILAKDSFAEFDDYFAFLADDGTVMMTSGTEVQRISDLAFELKISGDGTTQNPGFTDDEIQNCHGFFVDTPHHKSYYLTFPEKMFTWGYDLSTGRTFTRASADDSAWRAIHSITHKNKVYLGDRIEGKIWELDPDAKDEGGETQVATMEAPSVSFTKDVFIPKITVEMETGVQETPSTTPPYLMVRYSKDGGVNWVNHSSISLGKWGEFDKRVVLRRFGRVVRHTDFILELSVSDAVRTQIYSIEADVEESI